MPFSRALGCACFLSLCVWFSVQGCGPKKTYDTCTEAFDCEGSKICVKGRCQSAPPKPSEPGSEPGSESPGDASSEPRPEPTPERDRPEPPPPGCKDGATQSCTHPCGEGSQTCRSGRWSPCAAKSTTRPCYEGPAGTEGKGNCKAGTQTCDAKGKWGPCEGATTPSKETCGDGEDNDCNGKTDEKEAGCVCTPKQTQACGQKGGACVQGKQTCDASGSWGPCEGATTPSKELCDDKDNDCDGKVDEDWSTKGQPCSVGTGACKQEGKFVCVTDGSGLECSAKSTGGQQEVCDGKDNDCDGKVDEDLRQECYTHSTGCRKGATGYSCIGNCKAGQSLCQAGAWTRCSGSIGPSIESCRDGKDNDCDGLIDEICGSHLIHGFVSPLGTLTKSHSLPNVSTKVTRKAAGSYEIIHSSKTYGCDARPLFLSTAGQGPQPIAYTCSSWSYRVSISKHGSATSRIDAGFRFISPMPGSNEAYGRITGTRCSSSGCLQYSAYGGASVKRISTGVYEITHGNCLTSTPRPYFVTIYSSSSDGYATIMPSSRVKVCTVRTFDLTGDADDRSFAYWLPNPSLHAWVAISNRGAILAGNTFRDQTAKWTSQFATGYIDVAYPGAGSPSAVIANALYTSRAYAVVPEATKLVKLGVRVRPFAISTTPKISFLTFTLLFAQ